MAQARLSLEDKICCIRRHSVSQNAKQVVREWPTLFQSPPPTVHSVVDVNRHFDETESVDDLPEGGALDLPDQRRTLLPCWQRSLRPPIPRQDEPLSSWKSRGPPFNAY